MPLYEYVCKDCDDHFDQLVRNRENADAVTCQSCDSGNVRRLISSFATVGGLDDPVTPLQTGRGGGCCGGSCGCGH